MPVKTSKPKVPRSFAVDEDIWKRAKERAESEGLRISSVMNMLVEGYANGQVPTPRTVTTYGPDEG